jgi:hypothetical protein
MCEGSTGNRLLNAAKAVQKKGLLYAQQKPHCEAFVARKACTVALEQSVRKLSEDKQQSTLFTSLDILW